MAKLTLIPTPIGNMNDLSLRALETLKKADLILCEDTRHTKTLFSHFGVEAKLMAFHQHNEHRAVSSVIERLKKGDKICLVSDAGTPGISDPGFLLVRHCIDAGVGVTVLPGATSIIPAVVGSGLPCERFSYEGFLPPKKGRQTRWEELQSEAKTIVLLESPHRILKTLSEAAEWMGAERDACVVREISKMFETYHRGTLAELCTLFEDTSVRKGEMVVVIEGKTHYEKRKKKEKQ